MCRAWAGLTKGRTKIYLFLWSQVWPVQLTMLNFQAQAVMGQIQASLLNCLFAW